MFAIVNAREDRARRGVGFHLAPLAAAIGLSFSGAASAATITVNNGGSTSVAGSCTIVDAVASINQGSLVVGSNCANVGTFGSSDTIEFDADYDIVFSTSANGRSALVLTKPLTIKGAVDANGKPLVTIRRSSVSGTAHFRVLETNSDLTLYGVTISNGYSDGSVDTSASGGDGGGVLASGRDSTITITNSVLSGNIARSGGNDGLGGGIYAITGSTLSLTDSSITGNMASVLGGGINSHGSITAVGSTISGNVVPGGLGGGIYASGAVGLSNTTVSGNTAYSGGGGVYAGTATLTFCTIANNRLHAANYPGAGVLVQANSSATATLITGNGPGKDLDGANAGLTLGGDHDLIGTHGATIGVPADTKTCDPYLGPLFDNGGPTLTQPLFAGSCALDAGPADPVLLVDQRGLPRKIGAFADIGAFERQGPGDPPDLIFVSGFEP
ncbi:MAG TPA: right-handed parallel beta-helix repeat-containing protein [Rudaea sp.]|nr:right-handed parallel beta-helix repeat-containing protein [Rudaea sp.]